MKILVCTNARNGYGARIGRKPVEMIGGTRIGEKLTGVIYKNKRGGVSLARSWVKVRA